MREIKEAKLHSDTKTIIDTWERSVRATHHFLDEDYLLEIKELFPSFLKDVRVYKSQNKECFEGFIGIDNKKIEMLFIEPIHFGKGVGKSLVNFVIKEFGVDRVDVNEQNKGALGFYQKLGFEVYSRSSKDGMGKNYPILHLKLTKGSKFLNPSAILSYKK